MLIEKIIGTLADYPNHEVEYVAIEWYECHKKIIKKTLKNGEAIGIRLEHTHGLNNDDVLVVVDNTVYAIQIAKCEALVVDAKTFDMVPKVCYEIGNRHAPFYRGDTPTEFYTPYEMPVKVMLEKLGVDVKLDMVELSPNRAISSSNGGGHSHSHDGGYDGKGGSCPDGFYDEQPHEHSHGHHNHDHSHEHSHTHSHDGGKTFHSH